MPGHGRVVEVLVDVVVHATGHVLEERRHVSGPAAGRAPSPGGVVEHGAALDLEDGHLCTPANTHEHAHALHTSNQHRVNTFSLAESCQILSLVDLTL